MSQLSLARNIQTATTLDELKFQLQEFVSTLEDFLNHKVDIFLVDSVKRAHVAMESIKIGDLVFDFKVPGVATLQQWDGKKFITFNLANFEGYIDLIEQGIGSGTDPTLYLRSDGAGGWVLDSPSKLDTAEVNATVDIPAFSMVTADGKIADSSGFGHFGHVVGISLVFTLTGFVVTVVTEGEVTNPAWTWINNQKIFLNGTSLSTTPPTSGFSQFIALARNNNTIYVRLQQPIRI
jgi:hypothetical protein